MARPMILVAALLGACGGAPTQGAEPHVQLPMAGGAAGEAAHESAELDDAAAVDAGVGPTAVAEDAMDSKPGPAGAADAGAGMPTAGPGPAPASNPPTSSGGEPCSDGDSDGVCDAADTCEGDDRVDQDGDGVADACDTCEGSPDADEDGDGWADACDQVLWELELEATLPGSGIGQAEAVLLLRAVDGSFLETGVDLPFGDVDETTTELVELAEALPEAAAQGRPALRVDGSLLLFGEAPLRSIPTVARLGEPRRLRISGSVTTTDVSVVFQLRGRVP